MIKAIEMFTVICDRCGVDANRDSDYSCWSDESSAVEMAENGDWQTIDGKHYCWPCLELDEEMDEWKPKANIAGIVARVKGE